jgi:glycosyltransferase involved in cell wall biosynthesis
MMRAPLRRLLTGASPAPDRIFFYSPWFRGHNNPRYSELLPRLERLDRYLLGFSDRRIVRGTQFRAWRATRGLTDRVAFGLANRRYASLFTADNAQILRFAGRVVSDVDDPKYTDREVRQLQRPNLIAYVVTAERAARRFEQLGVDKPWHVIPQGFSRADLDPEASAAVRARHPGGPVIGYMAAWLLTETDRGGENPLYNVDHLLELWEQIHARLPDARLWLIGGASDRVRERLRARGDVVLFGRMPRAEALNHAASFDVALYPRTADQGIRSSKIGEYIGLGLPTVSYDFAVTDELRETGSGILVDSPRAFVDAVVALAADEPARATLAAAARRAGTARDWDVLAREYGALLDRYLPPARPARR